MSTPAIIITTIKLRPGKDAEFTAWKAHHDTILAKFPGFVSSDIIPPTRPDSNEWTIILNFRSKEDLVVWQKSKERVEAIAEGLPLFEGGNFGEVVQVGESGERPDSNVTEVIFSKIKPGQEDTYREWAARIQSAQAKYPGYKGTYLQPPDEKGGFWTTIMRFDSASHLEGWMNAPERKDLLRESKAFIEHEQLTRLATSFPGWFPTDPKTGKGPPNWKAGMLVLLGLFPIVMLEAKFLSPQTASLNPSLAMFIGNVISCALTTYLTMPLFIKIFPWWLFPKSEASKIAINLAGTAVIFLLYAISVAALWHLL
jgi:antibiotic biosynthesis monooxygenase (ABM) superfamily enzyme